MGDSEVKNTPIDTFRMETNLPGLLTLLAEHLYSDPDVFVRELIQNAHDAIVERRRTDPDVGGRIDVEYHTSTRTFVVRDNGIGMDEDDVKKFLSIIGASAKRNPARHAEELRRVSDRDVIGQFGIGLLSAFVVAEKITVSTLKATSSNALQWENNASTDCELYGADKSTIGTDVILKVREEYDFVLDQDYIRRAIVKYCQLLQFPIFLSDSGPLNTAIPPWHRVSVGPAAEREKEYRNFLRDRFPDILLDVIPFEIEGEFRASGGLLISDRRSLPSESGGVDVFVKRMFIKAADTSLLPPWAGFIRGVIDSPDLEPNASRDNIKPGGAAFKFIQQQLSTIIIQRLIEVASSDQDKFRRIVSWHQVQIKGIACSYDEFFEKVAHLLIFETNRGPMSLADYATRASSAATSDGRAVIYYFTASESAGQFFRMADAKDLIVINAGAAWDSEILEKYGRRNTRGVVLEKLDITDSEILFERLTSDEEERLKPLELELEGRVRRIGAENIFVRLRKFAPPELPAILLRDAAVDGIQEARGRLGLAAALGAFEGIEGEIITEARSRPAILTVNAASPLVQRLASFADFMRIERSAGLDRDGAITTDILIGIHNSAFLHSRGFITQRNAEVIHSQFLRLFDRGLTLITKIDEKERRLAELGRRLQVDASPLEGSKQDHIVLFAMMPFDERYRKLENALRRVFERPPYFFQLRLARDYQFHGELLPNVRALMAQSDGYVAEISDLIPNVMFELGAVMNGATQKPVFPLVRSESTPAIPADIRSALFLSYSTLESPVELLEAEIRNHFERDGRPAHAAMSELVARRNKLFLSRTLLEGIGISLTEVQRNFLLQRYTTVEALLADSAGRIASSAAIPEHFAIALRGELASMSSGGLAV